MPPQSRRHPIRAGQCWEYYWCLACHFERSITGFTLEKGSFRGRPIWSIQQAKAGVVRSPACECSSAFSLHPLHHRTDRRTGRHGTIERAGCMPPTWPDLSCRRRRRDRCERKRRMGPGATPECMADSSDIIRERARARSIHLARGGWGWRRHTIIIIIIKACLARASGRRASGETSGWRWSCWRHRQVGRWPRLGAGRSRRGVNSQQWPSGRLQQYRPSSH